LAGGAAGGAAMTMVRPATMKARVNFIMKTDGLLRLGGGFCEEHEFRYLNVYLDVAKAAYLKGSLGSGRTKVPRNGGDLAHLYASGHRSVGRKVYCFDLWEPRGQYEILKPKPIRWLQPRLSLGII
jgi:hypothetical protein